MKFATAVKLIAIGAIVTAGPALAGGKGDHHHQRYQVYSPYPLDTVCDDVNCYTPGTAYFNGAYVHLICKDPHKILTYREGVLKCVKP